MEKESKTLTELQLKFLEALFGEAEGNPRQAMRLAGYSEATSTKEVTEALQDEIIKLTKVYLGSHAAKAGMKLVKQLDNETPNANLLKAISMIMDKVGLVDKSASDEVNLKVPSGGLFILPAKEVKKDIEEETQDA